MKFWQSVRMAFQTLLAKKGRTFLTMLGTAIGVTAVIALVSVTKAQNAANMDLWRKLSENMVQVYFYSYEYMAGATPNSVIARELNAYINNDLADLTEGITPSASEWRASASWSDRDMEVRQIYYGSEQFSYVQQYELDSGRDLTYMDIERGNQVVVIGSMVRDRLFSYRDPLGETVYIKNIPFTIVGVYRERMKKPDYYSDEDFLMYSEDNMMVVPYTASRYINPEMTINEYMIKVFDPNAAREVVELLNDFLGTMITQMDWNNYDGMGFIDWNSFNGSYNVWSNFQWYDDMDAAEQQQTRFLTLIAAISLFVGGIGIMNIMLVTVTERTREIGVRKAIGAPRRTIVTQFLIEAAILSGAGGLLGVIAGFTVTLYWGKMQYDLIAQPDLPITFVAFSGSLAMGIIFGIYPAIKAASLQPVDALRTE
ncbi:MAG: ABC transporter permease [Oscillospiraceae bacterium]|jgi:putative ABC transport system permease protein|nr:ABC transporter permease [Oscillospiraceae bacterium]